MNLFVYLLLTRRRPATVSVSITRCLSVDFGFAKLATLLGVFPDVLGVANIFELYVVSIFLLTEFDTID